MPVIRTDSGPQFIRHRFEQDCLSKHEFESFQDLYKTVSEYYLFFNQQWQLV
ncbi:hypothetical protein [Anoxybacillus sp. P3H1B]|uniref:hypothetical protein n=1 Tax=Anoxybacillus sp. P3H1B TaxID=1769293 RepID=UPI000AE67F51|nr:hypothetical protein [Anoxybacillus sp. P3H1B]